MRVRLPTPRRLPRGTLHRMVLPPSRRSDPAHRGSDQVNPPGEVTNPKVRSLSRFAYGGLTLGPRTSIAPWLRVARLVRRGLGATVAGTPAQPWIFECSARLPRLPE